MSCEAIRSRVIGPIPHPRLNFSIAFAKGVHTDYEFLEMGLATTYSPENHYCFAVDSKSTPEFQHRFRMLASCLPNVYLTPVKRSMTSAGAYVNRAHLDCLEATLGRKAVKWMTQDVNLTTLIDHLTHNKTGYGVDEQFIATLALSETLLMPGGLHHRCGGKPGFSYFTRYTIWKGDCKTRKWRKGRAFGAI
ncbi:unnamed protein product, partial [Mesorhabditis spiculigera]